MLRTGNQPLEPAKWSSASLLWWTSHSLSIPWGQTWRRNTQKIVQSLWGMLRSSRKNTVKNDLWTKTITLAHGCWPLFVCLPCLIWLLMPQNTERLYCPVLFSTRHSVRHLLQFQFHSGNYECISKLLPLGVTFWLFLVISLVRNQESCVRNDKTYAKNGYLHIAITEPMWTCSCLHIWNFILNCIAVLCLSKMFLFPLLCTVLWNVAVKKQVLLLMENNWGNKFIKYI